MPKLLYLEENLQMLCAEISPLNTDEQLQIAVKVIKLLVRRSPATLMP